MLSNANLMFSPIYLPLLGAALILVCKSFFPTKVRRLAEYVGVIIGLVVPVIIVLSLYPVLQETGSIDAVAGSYRGIIGITFSFDGLSMLMILLAASVTIPSWIYSRKVGPGHSSFTALILIQNAAISTIAMTSDLFNLFVCLEVMGVTAYVLIASSQKGNAVYASFSYLMISSSAMVFFLLGTFGLYRLSGSLSYEGIAQGLAGLGPEAQKTALLCLVLLVVPILLRVAVMPLSLWLIDAHSKAPHAVSAMLSGVLLKIPLFALIRVFSLSPLSGAMSLPLSWAGTITALLAVLFALAQSDAKQLLAYHSISQIGYVVSAWGLALHYGLETRAGSLLLAASFFHAFCHALFKALLFLSIGTATDSGGNRNVYTLRGANYRLREEGEKLPLTMLCYFIAALSITALPPFNGFFSKTLLTYSLKGGWQYVILSIAGAATVASFIKLSRIFLPSRQPLEPIMQGSLPRFPVSLHLGLLLLAVMCVLTGVFAPQVMAFIGTLLGQKQALGYGHDFFFNTPNMLKTLYTLLGGILLFAVAVSKPGAKVLHRIKALRGSFTDLFLGFALAIAALLIVLL